MTHRAPDPRTARTRAAILSATSELLGSTHGGGPSIAQIASRAGVSVGSVYVHFDSKDELVAQLIELAWARRRSDFEAIRELESPLDRVLAFGDALIEFAQTEPVAFRALRTRAMDPPVGPSTTEGPLLATYLEYLHADITEAAARGEITGGSPRAIGLLLVATWSGVAEQVVRRDGLAIDADTAEAVRLAARAVFAAGLRPAVVAS